MPTKPKEEVGKKDEQKRRRIATRVRSTSVARRVIAEISDATLDKILNDVKRFPERPSP